MEIVENKFGRWVKGGIRYRVTREGQPIDKQALISDGYELSPLSDLEKAKIKKRNEMAEKRWEEEVGGITFGGNMISTDRNSQAMLTAAYVKASFDPNFIVNWKCCGGFIQLDADSIIAIGDVVTSHVESAFSKEALKNVEIDNATTLEEIELITW